MTLYLLPNLLHEDTSIDLLPRKLEALIPTLNGIIAESEKGGRHFLRRFSIHLPIELLNEHTKDISDLLQPLQKGENWGLISDAGLPCLADPGYQLVALARQKNIRIEALAGPSSILLALMLSGLPAQSFVFHGYLPREKPDLIQKLRQLEKDPMTHLFIETPYRNQKTLETLIETLAPTTTLCIASNLTHPSQLVLTHPISNWRKQSLPNLKDIPTIYGFARSQR